MTKPQVHLGNLEPLRDFTYVDDTVEGFLKIGQEPEAIGQVINVGSGREISIQTLAEMIIRIVGREVVIIQEDKRIRPRTSEVERLCADIRKAQVLIGWVPQIGLEEGLSKTIGWIERNIDRYKVGRYTI